MQKYLPLFEKILNWLVMTLIIFIPLYQKFPLFRIKGTFVAIRLEDILILVTVITWLLYLVTSKKLYSLLKDKLTISFLVFLFVGAASIFSSSFVLHSTTFKLALFHFARRMELVILFFIGLTVIKQKKQLYLALFSLFLVLIIVNFYALGQKYFHLPAVSTTNSELSKGRVYYLGVFDRVNSTFAGHYDLAIFLMMGISFLTPIFIFVTENLKKNKMNFKYFTVLGLLIGLSFFVLVLTAARLSFVALIAAIFICMLMMKKYKYILVFLAICLLTVIFPSELRNRLISTVTVNLQGDWSSYSAVSENQEKRSKLNISTLPAQGKRVDTVGADAADIVPGEPIDTVALGVYRSFEIRVRVEWPRAIRAFAKNPLLGTGYSSVGLAVDNDFLRSLAEVGLLGTTAFILFLAAVVKSLIQKARKSNGFTQYYYFGIFTMIIAFLINSLFIDVFEATKAASIFWLMLGITLGQDA